MREIDGRLYEVSPEWAASGKPKALVNVSLPLFKANAHSCNPSMNPIANPGEFMTPQPALRLVMRKKDLYKPLPGKVHLTRHQHILGALQSKKSSYPLLNVRSPVCRRHDVSLKVKGPLTVLLMSPEDTSACNLPSEKLLLICQTSEKIVLSITTGD